MKFKAVFICLLPAFASLAQYNPVNQNPFPYGTQSWYIQENNNVQQNIRAAGDGMAAAGMMARIERLEKLAALENKKILEENRPLFLDGKLPNLPKGKIVEPGIFDSDEAIWIKSPITGRKIPVSPELFYVRKDWNDQILAIDEYQLFVVSKSDAIEAMKNQNTGPYGKDIKSKTSEIQRTK